MIPYYFLTLSYYLWDIKFIFIPTIFWIKHHNFLHSLTVFHRNFFNKSFSFIINYFWGGFIYPNTTKYITQQVCFKQQMVLSLNQMMADRCLWSRRQGPPRNMGPAATARPVTLTTPQCCMHRPVMKCVQANTCPCRAANCPCTSGWPLENFRNWGPTWGPTVPRLTTNMRKTIEDTQEAAPIICQAIDPVFFHQDAPAFSPSVLPRGDKWPALRARTNTAHTAPYITKTATPNTAAPAAVVSGNKNSNHARPTDGQTASPSPPVDQDSGVTLVESIGESDGDSDYVESSKTSSTRTANNPDLARYISELEEMHKVAEGELVKLA